MDRLLRTEICNEVAKSIRQALEGANEVWLTGEELTCQFGMFTKSWLKTYGHTLPRTQAVVTKEDGSTHRTGWCYPRNKIQRMINEGKMAELKC
jgi:hypothetical protein